MIELGRLVEDFAAAIQRADGRSPQAVGSRTGRAYQPGIGPHTEGQTIRLVTAELVTLDGAYAASTFDVPYPNASRQRCDWCLGSPPSLGLGDRGEDAAAIRGQRQARDVEVADIQNRVFQDRGRLHPANARFSTP